MCKTLEKSLVKVPVTIRNDKPSSLQTGKQIVRLLQQKKRRKLRLTQKQSVTSSKAETEMSNRGAVVEQGQM